MREESGTLSFGTGSNDIGSPDSVQLNLEAHATTSSSSIRSPARLSCVSRIHRGQFLLALPSFAAMDSD